MVWSAGIYLGTTLSSNEAYSGLPDGNVTRARALTRIRPDQRWRADLIARIAGTPDVPSVLPDDSILEAFANPHVHLDAEQRAMLDEEADLGDRLENQLLPPPPRHPDAPTDRAPPRLRITRKQLKHYGYSPGCPRCTDIGAGDQDTNKNHNESCRARIYGEMRNAKDPLYDHLRNYPDKHDARPPLEPASSGTASRPTPGPPDGPIILEDFEQKDFGAIVDMLVDLGADVIDANRYVCQLVKAHNPASMYEIYGRGQISKTAALDCNKGLNVRGVGVLDFRFPNPLCKAWDFARKEDREMATAMIGKDDPEWVIAAPPCRFFSIVNLNCNYKKKRD